MKKQTTITGEQITVTPVPEELRYLIQNSFAIYTTHQLTQEEYDSNELNTGNDWANYIKSDDVVLLERLT